VRRREDVRLLRGQGRFVEDIGSPGCLRLGFVRSPHAHARVVGIDRREALDAPGTVSVLTAEDLPELWDRSVPPLLPAPLLLDYVHPVLAQGVVRHVGEAIAVVVSDDPYRLADALDLVRVDYEPCPASASVDQAQEPDAPRVHPSWPGNLAGRSTRNLGSPAALAGADVVVECELRIARVAGMPIECRGVVASVDPLTGLLTVMSATQVPFEVRTAIARALSIPEERVRVLPATDVGGGFGVKGHVYPEEIVVAAVARRLGRPVKWIESRREHLVTAAHERDQRHRARLGVSSEGRIVAAETEFTRDHGAYPTTGDAMTVNTMNHLVAGYRVPNVRAAGDNIVTHKTFAAAYRGAGRPEAAFVIERLLDRAARRLRLDPAEIRRRNLVRPDEMPYATGLVYRDGFPIVYDRADFPASFERLLALFGYEAWRGRQRDRRGSRSRIGIGLGTFIESTGLGPYEGATVRVDPNGQVFVVVAVPAQGQSHETTLAQICADQLGVRVDDVVVSAGDTSQIGYSIGTIASRVAATAGPSVHRAAREVADRARLLAAERLECAPEDIVLSEGRATVAGSPQRALPLAELARVGARSHLLAQRASPGLCASAFHYAQTVTWGFGAHAAALEVDLDTCDVTVLGYAATHDCGRPINPAVVEGQVHGGIAQGLGAALIEELVYDETGQPMVGTLMEYAIPRADRLPFFESEGVDFPSDKNPLGVKGVGEGSIIPPMAVIANAIEDACSDHDVEVNEVPLTSSRLFAALRRAGLHPDGTHRTEGGPR
jgi:carbon-monoxide dehydrogenase large subunit